MSADLEEREAGARMQAQEAGPVAKAQLTILNYQLAIEIRNCLLSPASYVWFLIRVHPRKSAA